FLNGWLSEDALQRLRILQLLQTSAQQISVWQVFGIVCFGEAPLDHVFNLELFHAHQVQNHVVAQTELALETCGPSKNHPLQCWFFGNFEAAVDNHYTTRIESTTSSSSTHLSIFRRE